MESESQFSWRVNPLVEFERQKDMLGCDEAACMAEIGGALGADILIGGSIAALSDEFLLSVRAFDAKKTRVAGKTTVRFSDKQCLDSAIRQAATSLVAIQ